MPKNKKKFISKKNAVTFHLVHRSQKDPLAADESAPQHVLKEFKSTKNKGEEHKYGIFFDDDYDYMQHLKNVSDIATDWEQVNYKIDKKKNSKDDKKVKVVLPSSVFESEFEEPVGLLNKAVPINGPRLELDPDVVAAMDDDFDYNDPENILEDNFIELANEIGSEESSYETENESDDFIDDLRSNFSEVETKSRFTNYSMTSSVMRRNEQLTILDNHFEKVFEKYDSNEIGSLPAEDIEGNMNVENEQLMRLTEKLDSVKEDIDSSLKEKTLFAALNQDYMDNETDILIVPNEEEKWDCESILTTYSNLYNHPGKICEPKDPLRIKINKKTGMPMNILGKPKLTAEALSRLDNYEKESGPKSVISCLSELSIRPKNESPEEKRIRKQNLKNYRRDRRQEKKANSLAFKDEKSRQEKVLLNFKNNQGQIKIV